MKNLWNFLVRCILILSFVVLNTANGNGSLGIFDPVQTSFTEPAQTLEDSVLSPKPTSSAPASFSDVGNSVNNLKLSSQATASLSGTAAQQPQRLFVSEGSGEKGKATPLCTNPPSVPAAPYAYTISCTPPQLGTTTTGTGGSSIGLGTVILGTPCELATGGLIAAAGVSTNAKSVPPVVCTDFIEPMPAENLNRIPGSSCVVYTPLQNNGQAQEVVKVVPMATAAQQKSLCYAVLTTTGNISILSSTAFFFVDTLQNVLIGAAIVAVVIVGIMMMFSKGNDDSMKKAKAMMRRILTGLALLLILKILLSTVNPAAFSMGMIYLSLL